MSTEDGETVPPAVMSGGGVGHTIEEYRGTVGAGLLQRAVDAVPDLLYVYDCRAGTVVYASRAFGALLGYVGADITRLPGGPAALVHPDDRPAWEEGVRRLEAPTDAESGSGGARPVVDITVRVRHADGSWHWLYTRNVVLERGPDGGTTLVAGIARDWTEEHAARERLEILEAAVLCAGDALCISAPTPFAPPGPPLLFANPAYATLTGYTADEINAIGTVALAEGVNDDAALREVGRRLIEDDAATGELRLRRKDGAVIWVEFAIRAVRDARGEVAYFVHVIRETTARKALEAERERLLADALARAERDPLTGLYNHAAFHRRLAEAERAHLEATARSASAPGANRLPTGDDWPAFGVVVLDVDNFKYFNETFGHLEGDAVLRRLAGTISATLAAYPPTAPVGSGEPGGGDAAARLGGDEFALLLTGRDRAGMVAFLESLRAAVAAEPYLPAHDGPPVPLGLTHGLAVFPGDGAETGVATLALADSRLLAAKRSGQARWSAELRDELTGSLYGFVLLDNLVTSLDARDRYTRRHMEEAAYHALLIADALNLPDTDRRTLEVAGLVYDIGKIGIPDDILRLPRALSPEELAVARVHPVLGASLVGSLLDRPDVPPVVRHHHENWDGSGYPDGLAGEEIPLLARVLAVADAYTALLSDRPHRRAFSRAAAREIIRAGAGTRFCPACAAALM